MRNKILLSADALDLAPGAATPVVDELQAYLSRFGWLRLPGQEPMVATHEELPEAVAGHFDEGTEAALSAFQRFHRLPVNGRLNAPTLDLMRSPRCGVPDKPPASGEVGFVAGPTKWANFHLSYRLTNSTADLSNANVNRALKVAYRHWCLVAKMELHQVSSNADIDVRFATGDHGDGANNAFDGVGTVLAHAFYPPNGGGAIAGDLHFDDAETWTRDLPPTGIDLDTVTLHEAGHTLGLDHSADANAVMFAFYAAGRRTLTADDIAGIRSLYGERRRNLWTNIDTAIDGEGPFLGKAYMFKGPDYLRYDYGEDLPDPGYPRSIAATWRGLPAAFTSNLDAAINGQKQFAGKVYLFKGAEYVRYDWAADKTDAGYPRSIAATWPGLPAGFTSGIQAALNGQKSFEGKLYLFKGTDYARYDWTADRGDSGYPLPIEFNWL
jgi:peptidoglycan hydrolase-like protein with peptidoglycan-binding domain